MKKVLVVEDDASVRESLEQLLEIENFDVISAVNGRVGLELARQHIPDLIICDVMMPELSGYEVIDYLKNDPATNTIPFIFLTARGEKDDIRRGMNLGADDYLNKPFTIAELMSAVNARLRKNETTQYKSDKKLEELRNSIGLSLPHELNTPLVGILGYAEAILQYADEFSKAEIIDMVANIHAAAVRQKRLIERVLLYSHLQMLSTDAAALNQLKRESTLLNRIFVEAIIDKSDSLTARAHNIMVQLDEGSIGIHNEYLSVVVSELLDNCIKFSPAGSQVTVEGRLAAEQYQLKFIDSGRGLSAGQISKIGAFMQFDRLTFEQQGAGLGLSMASLIVKHFGGSMTISSSPGEGTSITIAIPLSSKDIKRV